MAHPHTLPAPEHGPDQVPDDEHAQAAERIATRLRLPDRDTCRNPLCGCLDDLTAHR